MEQTVAQIEVDLGPIDTLIYNAGNGVWKNYDKTRLLKHCERKNFLYI